MTDSEHGDYVNLQGIADRLGYSYVHINNMYREGKLPEPAFKFGRVPGWTWDQIVEWAIETGRGERVGVPERNMDGDR